MSVIVSNANESHEKFLDFAEIYRIDGQSMYCKESGHMRKDCPKAKCTYTKCGKSSHTSSVCGSYASSSDNAIDNFDVENLVELANRINSNANEPDSDDDHIQVDDESVTDSSYLIKTNPDLEIIKSLPATTSTALTTKANPEQSIDIKKENVKKVQSKI